MHKNGKSAQSSKTGTEISPKFKHREIYYDSEEAAQKNTRKKGKQKRNTRSNAFMKRISPAAVEVNLSARLHALHLKPNLQGSGMEPFPQFSDGFVRHNPVSIALKKGNLRLDTFNYRKLDRLLAALAREEVNSPRVLEPIPAGSNCGAWKDMSNMTTEQQSGMQHVDAMKHRKFVRSQVAQASEEVNSRSASHPLSLAFQSFVYPNPKVDEDLMSSLTTEKQKGKHYVDAKNQRKKIRLLAAQQAKNPNLLEGRSYILPEPCDICLSNPGHFDDYCPYLDLCPPDSEIGDAAAKVCFCCERRKCSFFPGNMKGQLGYCVRKCCAFCSTIGDHWCEECPTLTAAERRKLKELS